VARIAAQVEEASRTKASTQLFIEKVEQRYSVGMVAATIVLFVVPLLFGDAVRDSLLRAMTFMIVASPCAVVLATMPPLLAAIANAGRHGVLVKSAVVMEQLGTTTRIAFDKTGTLTRGVPELAEIHVLAPGMTDDDVLVLAAAAEHPSEHPLGAAIVRAAKTRGLRWPAATDFIAKPGLGVSATVNGARVTVASPSALPDALDGADAEVGGLVQQRGCTAVIVTAADRPIGVLGLTDQLRPDAPGAVTAAARLTGRTPVLLTGDNDTAAKILADRVGITDVRAGLLPHDKVDAVAELQADGTRLAMVGDGINDAPALAAAHTGVAMGGAGSDLTLQTADAVIIGDDLNAVATVIALSRRARRVVVANLAIAATFIAALVIWDLTATLPLPLGVAGHEGSTVIVGLNGLRLLRSAAWRSAADGI
jgi:heavy metal translocating P-type ATPase